MPLIFRTSPIIRITLLTFYIALTLPLPFFAKISAAPVSPQLLWLGIAVGFIGLSGALSERVIIDDRQIQVTYSGWFAAIFRRGWSLQWSEIEGLKLRTTGQGGLVYYFTTPECDLAYLLPMRIVEFARLVRLVEEKTGIDTADVRPLAQPWMYFILFGFALLLLLVDAWILFSIPGQQSF